MTSTTTWVSGRPSRGVGASVGRSVRRLLLLAGSALVVVLALSVASAFASHGRGTNLSVSVDANGIATVTALAREAGSCTVGQPTFAFFDWQLDSMPTPGGARTFVNAGTEVDATCVRTAGSFREISVTFTIDLSAAPDGWYVVRHESGNKVGGILNAGGSSSSMSGWSSEAQFQLTAGQAGGTPSFGVSMPFVVSIGYDYSQNLNAVDPDGSAVVATTRCCNSGSPDWAVTYDVIDVTGGEVANQQIFIPASTTGTLTGSDYLEWKVRVTDADGEYAEFDMVLSPTTNVPPTITSPTTLAHTIPAGQQTVLTLGATDPDVSQNATFATSVLPPWATLQQTPGNPASGTLTLDPPPGTSGVWVVNLNADDDDPSLPATASTTLTITVVPGATVGPPGPPQGIGLSYQAGGQATVRWSPPASDGGDPVTGYEIRYRPRGSTGPFQTVIVGPDATSATLTGLQAGVAYEIEVSATNGQGNGTAAEPLAKRTSYRLVGGDGGVFGLGNDDEQGFVGSVPQQQTLTPAVVGMAATPDRAGYWLAAEDGGVFAYGTAPFRGSLPSLGITTSAPVSGITADPLGRGYWLVGIDGAVYGIGEVPFHGSLPGLGIRPSAPIVAIIATPEGDGYWLIDRSGGVFSFGAAQFHGAVETRLDAPVTAAAATPDGGGYWLVGSDGGVFAFGTAGFHGSLPGLGVTPNARITGITGSVTGGGYSMVGADGGVYAFGDAEWVTSLPALGLSPNRPVVGIIL